MPKTRTESIFFTAITAWLMVYIMTVYNTVLASGSFTNCTFLIALKGMWIEYIIIFLLAYFVSGHLANFLRFVLYNQGTDLYSLYLLFRYLQSYHRFSLQV